jgi:putative methyltransferase (TIGR04325 family)
MRRPSIPEIVAMLARPLRGWRARRPHLVAFHGSYPTWAAARAASAGYDAAEILEKTRVAVLKVARGEAAYERDSVPFDRKEYSWPAVACLMRVALETGTPLRIVDFGGSLGSTYFQNRDCFPEGALEWHVVEQAAFARTGRDLFESRSLRFHETFAEAIAVARPQVLLLSGVLGYLADPWESLREFMGAQLDFILLDRTGFIEAESSRICVQSVEPPIYKGSYPVLLFSERELKTALERDYQQVLEFDALDRYPPAEDGAPVYAKGSLWKRRRLAV